MADSRMAEVRASWGLFSLILTVLGYSLPVFVTILAWRDPEYREELFTALSDIAKRLGHIAQESVDRMDFSLLVTAIVAFLVAWLVTRFLAEKPMLYRFFVGLIITAALSSATIALLIKLASS